MPPFGERRPGAFPAGGIRILARAAAALAVAVAVAAVAWPLAAQQIPSRKPFYDAREHPPQYAGPGREVPAREDVGEVLIGFFGPSDTDDPHGADIWRAAQLAVEEANANGGYGGRPFRLVPGWSENPWGSGVARVARMVYHDRVWAVIGGIDGPSTHLAEQVAAKARVPLLSPAASDRTANLANVPWMFSLVPGDHLQAPVLAAEVRARVGSRPFVIVSADDHDSRCFARELNKALSELRLAPRRQIEHHRGAKELGDVARWVRQAEAAALILVAPADDAARLVKVLRRQGFEGTIFGGPTLGRRRFIQEAGAAAEGVVFPLLYRPDGSTEFARKFDRRFGTAPDYAAAHAYDAVQLLIAATNKAGLNRARIRDAVADLSPWPGVTGSVTWDPLGSNARPVGLASIRQGRIEALAEPRGQAATAAE